MTIKVNGSQLYFTKLGNGPKNLLLFHGFGQTHEVFNSLVDKIKTQYTCYCFDLYYHGQSTWAHHDNPLSKAEWQDILNKFIAENRVETFSMLGFSIGSRVALATLESFPEKIEKVFLLAPDGIVNNGWFRLATSSLLQPIFKHIMYHPAVFLSLLNLAGRFRILDKSLIKFVAFTMQTDEKRKRIYNTWMVLRLFQFRKKEIFELIMRNKTALTLIVGRKDTIIDAKKILSFGSAMPHVVTEVVDASHHQLLNHEDVSKIILK